jgi:hypothetical protein
VRQVNHAVGCLQDVKLTGRSHGRLERSFNGLRDDRGNGGCYRHGREGRVRVLENIISRYLSVERFNSSHMCLSDKPDQVLRRSSGCTSLRRYE